MPSLFKDYHRKASQNRKNAYNPKDTNELMIFYNPNKKMILSRLESLFHLNLSKKKNHYSTLLKAKIIKSSADQIIIIETIFIKLFNIIHLL